MKKATYDDDDEIKDGESVRVPMMIMDGRFAFGAARHQPGFRDASGDARVRDARRMARDARAEMIKRASNAWRTPVRDAGEPDAAEALLRREPDESDEPDEGAPDNDAGARMRGHLYGGGASPDDKGAGMREAAYRQRCNDLENAWRNPPGRADPGTALAIEHRRRAYTYETGR